MLKKKQSGAYRVCFSSEIVIITNYLIFLRVLSQSYSAVQAILAMIVQIKPLKQLQVRVFNH